MRTKLIIFFHLFTITLLAQQINILLDENFNDWDSIDVAYTDPIDDQLSGIIDFEKFWFTSDSENLYFCIQTGGEINLQDNNMIKIYIDSDNSLGTGNQVFGIGADIIFTFGSREGLAIIDGNSINIFHDDIGLVSSPTVTSDQFEFMIKRGIRINGDSLFTSDSIRVVFYDDGAGKDQLPDETGGLKLSVEPYSHGSMPDYNLSGYGGDKIRIISYNVQFDGIFNAANMQHFEKIFKALEPEIIGFQEIYNHGSEATAAIIESFLPSTGSAEWYHSKVDPDIVMVSRFNILSSYYIEGNGAFLLELDPIYESKALIIVAHPPCCSNNIQRQQEIDAIMAFIRDAKNPGGILTIPPFTPILILGDMNLVGDVQQRTTLLTGDIVNENLYGQDFTPDWDSTDFFDTRPYTTESPATFTWYDLGSSFSPGRLDYLIYSDSIIEMINSFVLFTPNLPLDTLVFYDLSSQDVLLASDHLPVVGDFVINIPTTVATTSDINEMNFHLEQNFPNPFNGSTVIRFRIGNRDGEKFPLSKSKIELFDTSGKLVKIFLDDYLPGGEHEIVFEPSGLSSGVYFYRMTSGTHISAKKLVYLK